jgi:phosphomannomutase
MESHGTESSPPQLVRVEPRFQHYAWGDKRFIPELYGIEGQGSPYAEAWLGAHAVFPSQARLNGQTTGLDHLIAENPGHWLGNETQQRFAGLPYLLKILSAAKPLSIQVHPSKAQAVAGFRRENAAGLALDAPDRSYRDDNHKPELLLALTRFYAVCGFRPRAEIAQALAQIPELAPILPAVDESHDCLRRVVSAYLAAPDSEVLPALSAWVERLLGAADPPSRNSAEHWVLESHRVFSSEGRPDRGLLFLLLLNLVVLEPWDALFLEAGVPHAYLEGAGVEVMASSDNVLRGGLTSKHVDVAELTRIVRFESTVPFVIRGEPASENGFRYRTSAAEFELERLTLKEDAAPTVRTARGPELLLFLPSGPDAQLFVRSGEATHELSRAETCLLPHGTEYELRVSGPGEVVRVTVPETKVPLFRGRQPTELSFGTSGLRGLVTDITDLETYVNVRGFLDYLTELGEVEAGGELVLAGDLRPSTDRIMNAVVRAVVDGGLVPINAGKIPTPALAYYALGKKLPSIMVTGSHIPFDRNGIKFYRTEGEVSKTDEAPIMRAVERVRRAEYERPVETSLFDDHGALHPHAQLELPPETHAARDAYIARYLDFFPADALSGLRVVVYEHSAVGRELLAQVLERLGAAVHPMARTETFVPIDTEAISDDKLAELSSLAAEAENRFGAIDAIVSTDGDSDRPLVLGVDADKNTRFFPGDLLGMLVADALSADGIAVPVSATDAIEKYFAERELVILRTRIGSPWVIAAMSELRGERRVGFEANGGFLVGSPIERQGKLLSPLPTRDAVLPIVTVLSLAKERLVSLPKLFSSLPARFGSSGLIDVEPAALRAFAEHYGLKAPEIRSIRFDGGVTRYTDAEGEYEAQGSLLLRAAGIRAALTRHFRPDLGFGPALSLDFRDGLRIRFEGDQIAHVRGSGNAPQLRIYALADSETRAKEIAAFCLREPDGILRSLLAEAGSREFLQAIQQNIHATEVLFSHGAPPAVIGTVSGTPAAQRFWQHALEEVKGSFRAREVLSFCEDLPVNQAFGLLLLWKRLRERFQPGAGALLAFVFGEGTRATPFTEAENGQKPAICSFSSLAGGGRRLSMVELAIKYFAPVETFLRRSGFDGMVVKWGDEVQIPTRDLSGEDPRFAAADVVRFVSRRAMNEGDCANKDWVGFDSEGVITRFVPRRPLREMELLADQGVLERRGTTLYGGVNLGSIAVSRLLLDELLQEFESEVLDPNAKRSARPDLDPQFFTALTLAALPDAGVRARAWETTKTELPKLAQLEQNLPGVFERLINVLERFEAKHGRKARFVVMDFGDQYWGDVGQHQQIYEFYMALGERSANGAIARALAGVGERRDRQGNVLAGNTSIGDAHVQNSVLIDCQIEDGIVIDSVLIGTRARRIAADHAFDVESVVRELTLGVRAGSYRVVSAEPVVAAEGERITTVFLPDGSQALLRVHENTDLRDQASTYDQPILGNPLSFRDVHTQMSSMEATALSERRRAAENAVLTAERTGE